MRTITSIMLGLAIGATLASRAHATPFADNQLSVVEPEGQNDKATLTTMPWCPPGRYTLDSWDIPRLHRAVSGNEDYDRWADTAAHLCEHKEDPTWRKQATYLVQLWMNARDQTQEDAEASIIKKIAKLKEEQENEGKPVSDETRFAFPDHSLTEIKADVGVDQVKLTGAPAWCDRAPKFSPSESWDAGRIGRTVEAQYGIEGTIEGALHICQRPNDATWKQRAGYILQKWMNWTHESQADAEKSLRARIQTDKFADQRTALCKALEVSPELGGKDKTYADAKRQLFGCVNKGQLLWQDLSSHNTGGVLFYLDGDPETDELIRVYWLLGYLRDPGDKPLPAANADDNLGLLYYAVAQDDLAKVDPAAIDKLVSAAPYNEYARVAMMETVAVLKARQRVYEQAVVKMTKGDEDYAAILRTAPKAGLAQWDKIAAQWKPEIERAAAYEHKFSSPSRKALKGCAPEFAKDAEKVITSFKTKTYKELVDKIAGDPAANVILQRASWCFAIDKVWGGSGALRDLVEHGRNLRGPRSLVYYAIVDAIADAKKDRPRLLLDLTNFIASGSVLSGDTNFDGGFEFTGHAPGEWEKSDDQGVVASVKKVDDGLQVEFKKVIVKSPDYDCVDDTRHPLRINSDGRIEYYQNCKANGKTNVYDQTPTSIVVHPLLAGGVKPGVFLRFVRLNEGAAKNGTPLGLVVFTKNKSADKTINSFLGFAL